MVPKLRRVLHAVVPVTGLTLAVIVSVAAGPVRAQSPGGSAAEGSSVSGAQGSGTPRAQTAGAAEVEDPTAGISRELARHRARTLSEVAYDIAFRIPAARDSTVTGDVTVSFVKADSRPLVLDFAEPADVRSVAVDGEPAEHRVAANHLVIPVTAGAHTVTLAFDAGGGPLNRRDAFLYTLFVPDRAHEAFPAFDQPDIKARYRLELSVPAGWTAVANGAVESREEGGDRVVYRFAETERIPTYLFAFAAGRFEVVERERDGRRMRLFHRETDSTKVARNVEALFDLHATALSWLEEYTDIPYPFGKFDFVAIPSFQYNGMEHPGAILYRASSLFLDESATRSQELSRASLIAHETAHMWFGDLVTMEWFNDVWMKEVFANFIAAKIVHPSFPELDHEIRFLLAHYPAAYSVDRTPGANPIRQPLANLDEAGSLYGAIIYQKAPIVMRQLERLTGAAPFREAVRAYLHAHRFGNAGWPALVDRLDGITELDVPAWSRVWIEASGRPWIDIDIRGTALEPTRIALRQDDPSGRGLRWDQLLALGLVRGDTTELKSVRLASDSAVMEVAAPGSGGAPGPAGVSTGVAAVIPNGDGLAYGLFLLDPTTQQTLTRRLPGLRPAVARAAGWLDLWELMLEGGPVGPDAMLDLARRMLAVEDDELIVEQLLGDLQDLYWRFVTPGLREREAAELEALLWREMLAAGSSSEKAAHFNAWRSIALTDRAIERMGSVWRGELEIPGLPLSERDETTLALHLAVREAPGWAGIVAQQEARIENPDRVERFRFLRPAVSADVAVRDSFFDSLRQPGSRAREEWVVTALSYLHHPLRADTSRRYILPSLELLEEVGATGDIFFPTRWLSATFSGHASPEAAAIVRAFIDANPELPPRLLEKVLQEADPLFRAVALRRSAR
ncbi:MAG: M1 family metallopeptidase [Candidatus Longimicrobiales bacterium M2_2A_002]